MAQSVTANVRSSFVKGANLFMAKPSFQQGQKLLAKCFGIADARLLQETGQLQQRGLSQAPLLQIMSAGE